MANSDLASIITALENVNVTLNGATVKVVRVSEAKDRIHSAELPVRVILPLAYSNEARSASQTTLASNTGWKVAWSLSDLFLYKPLAQGRGIIDHASELVEYGSAYINAIKAYRRLGDAVITQLSQVTFDVFEFPAGSGIRYSGAIVEIQVQENL